MQASLVRLRNNLRLKNLVVLVDSGGSVSIVFMRIIRLTCFHWNFKNKTKSKKIKLFFIFWKNLIYDFRLDVLLFTRIINN